MEEQVSKLYSYNVWANDRVLEHLKTLPPDILHKPLQSVFPNVFDTLVHVYRVDNIWLHAMSGDGMDVMMSSIEQRLAGIRSKTLEEMTGLFGEVAERYRKFMIGNDMVRVNELPHPEKGILKASNSELVQHVVNHGTYHRGNVTAMLRQMGHAGVPSDLVFYLFEAV